jgi:hypothetical protein
MKRLVLLIFGFCLVSCSLGMAIEKHLFGNYYLTAPDAAEQLGLTYKVSNDVFAGIIEETVFAVGYNKEYIIAKQHPANKEITNYYILPIKDGSEPKNEDLIGPLTQKEFTQKKKEFRIESLDFTIVYKDLE